MKQEKMTVYRIEQGMQSPRDRSIGWRYWDESVDAKAARKIARDLSKGRTGFARVIKCEIENYYENGKQV